jgi:hypothetical protein
VAFQRTLFTVGILIGAILNVGGQSNLPLRMDPFALQADSCYNPASIIDPVFQPRLLIKNRKAPVTRQSKRFNPVSEDEYFYFLTGLLFLLGFGVKAFPKYFLDISRLFFQDRFGNKSIRDQLMQNRQASLFLNLFFFLVGGTFLYLISLRIGLHIQPTWYLSLGFFILILSAIYLVKFFVLYLTGWILGFNEQMNAYIFIEFLMNKVVGIALVPMVIFLWLGREGLYPYFLTISGVLVAGLFLYRYRLLFPVIGNLKRVSVWHFFIYLCALELAPILIIAKILSIYLDRYD